MSRYLPWLIAGGVGALLHAAGLPDAPALLCAGALALLIVARRWRA